LATLPSNLAQRDGAIPQIWPGAATSPGDRILASIQRSRSLVSPADIPGGEDVRSVLLRAEARLERAQAHLEQVQARLEQWKIKREARLEARLNRAQARLESIQTRPPEQVQAHQLEKAQAHLEKVQAHTDKMRAHFEEVKQHLLAKAQARIDEAQGYLEEVQARLPPTEVNPVPTDPVGSYPQPFGPNAPWNIPVTVFPRRVDSDTYRNRLWDIGVNRPGNFDLTFDDYTYPVYDASTATMQAKVVVREDWGSNLVGKTIPWNPNWVPSHGFWTGDPSVDSQVIILDPVTGREWDLWQVSYSSGTVTISYGDLVPGSYWTREQGFAPSRGSGIPYLAMLVRPEEIAAGAIRHALSMPAHNIDRSVFVAPATKTDGDVFGVRNGIPEGMRFALDVTDADIEAWATNLSLSDVGKQSARIIATALRDYGWFITDNAGTAHIQFEDRATAGAEWEALGLGTVSAGGKEYPRDLLDGLMLRDRIYAVSDPSSASAI
jgi:hypothetical protein